MKIRAGNAPVSWGVMELEGWSVPVSPTDFLDQLASAGYSGTELGPYGYLPVEPLCLKAELETRGIDLISAFVPVRLKERDPGWLPLTQVCRLLQSMEARLLVLADAMWPEREAVAGRAASAALSAKEWDNVARNVETACKLAGGHGLRCVFHHHAGTYIETPEEIARLAGLTSAGLCLDTGHYVYGGGDPVEAIGLYGSRIEHLHFKDVNPERLKQAVADKLGFSGAVRAGVFCELGAGCVRFPELLAELDRMGYDGWAIVEQDADFDGPGTSTAFERARTSRTFLRGLGI